LKNKAKFYLKLLLSLTLLSSVYINFLSFKSLKSQYYLAQDLGKYELTADQVNSMLPSIPNITAVTIPINVSKAMYYIHEKRYPEAINLIDGAVSANPYTYVGQYLKSRVFLAIGLIDSARTNAKKAFYGWPKNIEHFKTYNETLVIVSDTLEIVRAYSSLDSLLKINKEFQVDFIQSLSKAKFKFLITEFSDSRDINIKELQGSWTRVYNFPNKVVFDKKYVFEFSKDTFIQLDNKYRFKTSKDSLLLFFLYGDKRKIAEYGLQYSDSLKTLILKGVKLETGIIQDQYYKLN
jgi:tetratricopeptide (TPR) repeat protein